MYRAATEICQSEAPHPQTFRCSLTTRLRTKGGGIRVVQILPGHSSLCCTRIYTHRRESLRRDLRELLGDFFTDRS